MQDKIFIIGYKGYSFTSKIIRRFTSGQYSHVEWLRNRTTLKGFGAFEKIGGVGDTGPHLHKPKTPYTIWGIDCLPKQKLMFEWHQLKQNEKPYDWLGILGFIRFKDTNDPQKWFCSELVTAGLKYANIPFFNWDAIKPGLVSPNTFVKSPLLIKMKEGET